MPRQISLNDADGPVPTMKFLVASGTVSSLYPGTPVKFSSAGAVAAMVDGDGTTSQRFAGIVKTQSNETAAAAGIVYTFIPLPGLIYAAGALSATAANTQAKIDALLGKRVVFDLTGTIGAGGQWTVDSAAADGATNCVVITGGEYQTNTLYFMFSYSGTVLE